MCFGNDSQSTTTTTSNIPANVQELTNKIAGKAGEYLDSSYTPYTGQRVADMNGTQNSAISGIQNAVNNNPVNSAAQQAAGMYQSYASAPANTIGSQSITPSTMQAAQFGSTPQAQAAQAQATTVGNLPTMQAASSGATPQAQAAQAQATGYDPATVGNVVKMTAAQMQSPESVMSENGALGSIQSYMDPYVSNVLQNTITKIDEAGQQEQNRIGSMAAMSGAFGDARHGILEGQNQKNVMESIGNAANSAYSQAFNNAMGLRSDDINRSMTADQFNAGNRQQASQFNASADQAGQFYNANAQNAAGQFGAAAQNAVNQFNAGNQQQVSLANQQANLNNSQFNAANQQQANQFNATAGQTGALYNANAQNAVSQFNAGNQQQTNLANQNAQMTAQGANQSANQAASQFNATANQNAQTYNADAGRAQDIFNAQQRDAALTRLYQSAAGLTSNATTQQGANLDALSALLGAGNAQQNNSQAQLDALYEAYLNQQQYPFDVLAAATSAASGIPYQRNQTSTTSQPDNSGWGAVGSLVSSFL